MNIAIINGADIKIGERQRKEFKAAELQDLADSILRVGLLHAPVVELQTDKLIAGERRLRALELTAGKPFLYGTETFKYPDVPVHFMEESDPKKLAEIELEENLRRVNLTPMEEAQAIASLHQIRLAEKPTQTVKDTTREVTQLQGRAMTSHDETKVGEALLVESFKDDPEVMKAAKVSMHKAAKVAKKKMELQMLSALNELQVTETNPLFTLIEGDATEVVKTFPENSFDILLFDPPYGVNADKFGEQALDLGHQYEDSEETATNFLIDILAGVETVLKSNAHVLMFCSFELFQHWKGIYDAYGYNVWPRPIIWYKGNQGHAPVPDYGPRYSYECVLFASRGKRRIAKLIQDVISVPAVRNKMHAAEKPTELLASLLDFTARPGDRILDPCVGSGSIFAGAKNREVYVTGIEMNHDSYLLAKEKIKNG